MCLTILTTSKPPILLPGYCNILSTDFLVSVFISLCIFLMVKFLFKLKSVQVTPKYKTLQGLPISFWVDFKGLAMTYKTLSRLAPIIKASFSIFLCLLCFASVTLVFLWILKHFSLCTAVQFCQHYSFSSSERTTQWTFTFFKLHLITLYKIKALLYRMLLITLPALFLSVAFLLVGMYILLIYYFIIYIFPVECMLQEGRIICAFPWPHLQGTEQCLAPVSSIF